MYHESMPSQPITWLTHIHEVQWRQWR